MTPDQRLAILRAELDKLIKENEERERILAANPQDWQTNAIWLGNRVEIKNVERKVVEI